MTESKTAWTFSMGELGNFEVYETSDFGLESEGERNGAYATRADALREVIASAIADRECAQTRINEARRQLRQCKTPAKKGLRP